MNYASNGDGSLRQFGNDVMCPCCGKRVKAFQVIQVTAIDITDEDWACDGCWTTWQRELRAMGTDTDILTPEEWFHKFSVRRGIAQRELDGLRDISERSQTRLRERAERSGRPDPRIQRIRDRGL